jgi:hypothetical protein
MPGMILVNIIHQQTTKTMRTRVQNIEADFQDGLARKAKAENTNPFRSAEIEIVNRNLVTSASKPGKRRRIQKPLYSVRFYQ